MTVIGFDTSNYTTSAAFFDGSDGVNVSKLLPGRYCLELIMTQMDNHCVLVKHDVLDRDVLMFEIQATEEKRVFQFANSTWGIYELPQTVCK